MSTSISAEMIPELAADARDRTETGAMLPASILSLAVGLMGIGAVMVFSASVRFGQPIEIWPLWESRIVRQLVFVLVGLVVMLVVARVPYRWWFAGRGAVAMILLLLSWVGLLLAGFGEEVKGARRWVEIPGLNVGFQPSELVKVAMPIFLASWMVLRVNIRSFWRGLLPIALVIGICIGGVGIEDFGTAALLAAVAGGMLLVGGARFWHLFLMVLPAVPAFGYLLISRAHRIERLKTFLDPWSDPENKGYQIIQSLCTIASGGWFGRGLGNGFVKGYLPEARNDFVFAVICEELGIVGAAAVAGLFVALVWQGRKVIVGSTDPVGRLLAVGIVLIIGLQAAMNIAVVTASVPTKGIALPLVSAGGSGAIFLGALIGVLASIARDQSLGRPDPKRVS